MLTGTSRIKINWIFHYLLLSSKCFVRKYFYTSTLHAMMYYSIAGFINKCLMHAFIREIGT